MPVPYNDVLYKYPPEVHHRALSHTDLIGWGRLVADAFCNRAPLDLVEIYFRNGAPRLFYSSLTASDARDNRLLRKLAHAVMQQRTPFRFPYYERETFADVRYTDVLTLGRSVLVLPIESNGETVGAVALCSRVPDVFSDNVLPLMAEQAHAVSAVYRTLFQPGNAHAQLFDGGYYFKALPDPVCVVNSDCKVTYANDAFQKFYAAHTGSAGNSDLDFGALMGDAAFEFRDQLSKALHAGEYTFEHTFLVSGYDVRFRVRLQRVETNAACAWFYPLPAEQPTEYESDETPFAVWQLNDQTLITQANPRFAELTGYAGEELKQRSFFELLHPGEHASFFSLMRHALNENGEGTFDLKLKSKSGGTVGVKGLYRFEAPSGVDFYGDDRFALVKENIAAPNGLVDALPVGLVVLDELYHCVSMNERAAAITGYSLREAQATAFPSLLLDDNHAQRVMDALAALDGNAVHADVYTLQSKVGERKTALTGAAMRSGDKTRYVLVLHDVTELHRDVQHWKETAHAAQDTQHAEEQYLARMSHEIRTAMNGIIGLTNVLIQTGLPGEQQQILNLIKQSTDNLLVIINDILDLSKIKSGKLQVEKIPVDLRVLFENLYAITLAKVGSKEIKYAYRVSDDVPRFVATDPVRLNQIMLNLLSNAIKFTDKGKVEYRVSLLEQNDDRVKLRFEVRDTGIGIEANALESVFESYKQATSSTTRHYGGTGLGLPIVKQLVELMGGRIDVTSEPGRGTTFAFTLPFRIAEVKPQTAEPAVAVQQVPPGLRVLVVDDNYINRLLVIHLLQSRGFEVVEAAGGYEALDKLREEDVDAVLMDISMPDLDGFEATKLIRRSEHAFIRDLPVIAMTAHGFQEQVNNAREAGMNDYVVKPFKPDALVRTILQQLGGAEEQRVEEPKPKPAKQAKLYDLAFLEDYYNNDRAFIKHILGLYVKETPPALEEMERAANEKDWPKFKALTHKIKTNVLMLGIAGQDDFFKASSQLTPDRNDGDEVTPLFERFQAKVSSAIDQIRGEQLS